jgi:tetratricopeptide (TPR) repeat protein
VLALLDSMDGAPAAMTIDAVIDWALTRHRLNQYDGVLDRLIRTIDLARAAGDEQRLATALSWTGNIHMVTGFPMDSIPYLQESQQLAEKHGNEHLLLLPLFLSTWSLVDRQPAAAVDALRDVIEHARRGNVNDVLGHATGYLAVALARLGRYDEARVQIAKALELAPRAGSPVKVADIHIAVGSAYYDMGDVEKGLEHSRIGAEEAARVNGLQCACAGYYGVGKGEFELHRLDQAIAEFDRSLDIAHGLGARNIANFDTVIRADRAMAEFEKGDASALERLQGALREAQSSNDEFAAATISLQLARVLVRLARGAEATPFLNASMDYFREREIRPYLATALDLQAELQEADGRHEDALLARAEAMSQRAGLPGALESWREEAVKGG